ncbi:uncharacterized protein [Miscanthus floridulus]|uniref:uncharacterized protein n=1 Tax=Miscanthus floridulus TaxID=154761 RepID=UPI003458B291
MTIQFTDAAISVSPPRAKILRMRHSVSLKGDIDVDGRPHPCQLNLFNLLLASCHLLTRRSSSVVAHFFGALNGIKEVNEEPKEADYFGEIVIAPFVDMSHMR